MDEVHSSVGLGLKTSTKQNKVHSTVRLGLLTSTPKPNQQAKPFAAVAHCTAKKEPGNPDKDLGTSSVAHKERRGAAYAILRI